MIAPRVRYHVPDGLTIIIEAPQRWGKTMAGVALACDYLLEESRNIFSNIPLAFEHQPLEFSNIKLEDNEDGQSKFWNGHIFIDELNFYFDARCAMKPENITFSTFLLQQKKQGCNLTGTTHDLYSLDLRIRDNYDYIIRPHCLPVHPATPEFLILDIENGPLQSRLKKRFPPIDCRPLMGLYNSFRVYDPFKNFAAAAPQKVGRRVELASI